MVNFCIKELLLFDSVFLKGELIDVERGYSEMHVFHVDCVFHYSENANLCVKELLFFVPGFLKGEWSDVAWISTCLLPSEEHWP